MDRREELTELVTSFPKYLDYVYSYIQLPSSTPLQQRIATHLGENPSRLIVEAARGVGKSYIAAIFTTWRLLRNVDEKILVISASGPKAAEISTFIRNLFEQVPLLDHLKPGKTQRDSILSFDVVGSKTAIAPSVSCLGITSQITGKRASLIIADDVEVPSNSMTEDMRIKLVNRVGELEALLIPEMDSSIIFAGTPQSQESIYNKLEYRTVVLPAQVPEDPMVYEGKLDEWVMEQGESGTAVDKVRFPIKTLEERRLGMGKAMYQLQYQLDTTLSDADKYPLKCKDMIVYDVDAFEVPNSITHTNRSEFVYKDLVSVGFTGDRFYKPSRVSTEYSKYDIKIMAIDPAGGSGLDEATYAVLGVKNGIIYLLDSGGYREGMSDAALGKFAEIAKKYQVNVIVPEKNWGAGMWTELFKKVLVHIYPCTVEEDFTVRGQKEVRILSNIEPLLTNHQLVVAYELVVKDYEMVQKEPTKLPNSLIYQMTHLTTDKGCLIVDDRVDSLAIGCQYLSGMVSVDVDKVLKKSKEKELKEWLYSKVYGSYKATNPNVLDYLRE